MYIAHSALHQGSVVRQGKEALLQQDNTRLFTGSAAEAIATVVCKAKQPTAGTAAPQKAAECYGQQAEQPCSELF